MRVRGFLYTSLLVLLASACTQAPGHSSPRSAKAIPQAEAFLLRFAAYGDTRDGHEVHRKIVEDVMSFHPALVLQTGDLRNGPPLDAASLQNAAPGR